VKQPRVLIMAGGTGGHVFPALAVAQRLQTDHVTVMWLGTRQGLEAKLIPPTGIAMQWIKVSGLRGKGWKRWLLAPGMLLYALVQALIVLRRCRPQLVLGMGGFVSGPGGIAAACLRTPLIVHEQNAIPGTTNRWLSNIADTVLQAFPESFPANRNAITIGNPVRSDITGLPPPAQRFANRSGRFRLLVLGGSQGARVLNQWVPEALAGMADSSRPEVWHQTGQAMYDDTLAIYKKTGIEARLAPFIEDMAQAYDWADLVLCRAGALTVAELTAVGIGAVLIPFPLATDDHQTANARFLERSGAALILAQSDLSVQRLTNCLQELLTDRSRLLSMAQAAHRLAQRDATQQVADICLQKLGVSRICNTYSTKE
jgi:UDP-N-acetylglucosamine--N-acetylmuramyl-(pentapeptide) pyrophosphoryl-undecaprenol N-acetylglucosamine transferase